MAVTITTLSQGDTNYIDTHNSNYQTIKVAVEALQAAVGAANSNDPNASIPVAYDAMFGGSNALLGESSYKPTQSGASTLDVASGFAYLSADDAVVTKSSSTTISFSGQTTGTYYIVVDEFGIPTRSESPAGALYSVDYNSGTGNFDSIDRVANLSWTQSDWGDVQTDLWNRSVDSLDDRITAAEKTSLGVLQKTVVASNITLTEAEAFEQAVIQLNDGPQTANVEIIVPGQPRLYQILNDCGASYTCTFKTSGGTGVAVTGQHWTLVYCDGVDCEIVFDLDRSVSGGAPPSTLTALSDTPSAYGGHANKLLKVNGAESAIEFFTPTYVTAASITFENLDANGDVGTGATQVAAGDHTHAGYAATAHTHVSADITDLASYLTDITGEAFTDLGDTPASYAGAANYTVRVNGAGTALEFVNVSAGSASFSGLSDTPANYTGAAKHAVKVNAAGDALEFVDDAYFTSGFFPGAGVASATMLVHVFAEAVDFPSGLTASQGTAETAATAQTDYDIQKNGASVGTMRFAAAASTATFIMASATSFAAGDKLQLIAPGTLDSTLADVSMTLRGIR
jgi:hypothetical protein